MGFEKPKGKVAVIGGANMDITGIPFSSFVPRDSNPGHVEMSPGGVGRNICENLARMGVQTVLFTAVGCDANGQSLKDSCEKVGIDVSCVLTCKEQSTSVYLSVNDGEGDMYCAVSDMEIVKMITPEYIESHYEVIQGCSVIFFDTNISEDTIKYIVEQFGHKAIFADTVSTAKAPRLMPILNKIYTLKPNRNEAELLSGMPIKNILQAQLAAEELCKQGVQNVAISLGEDGLLMMGKNGKGSLKPPYVEIGSANGAGDALAAGLIFSYLLDLDIDDTLKTGCAAARIALADKRTVSDKMSPDKLFEEVINFENTKLY